MKTTLWIPTIAGAVHLGCSAAERKKAQKIEVSIQIAFKKVPAACKNDSLTGTPCYADMSEVLSKTFAAKHYQMIEHLCFSCFTDIKKYLKKFSDARGAELTIHLKKVAPPIAMIKNGSHFIIQDKI